MRKIRIKQLDLQNFRGQNASYDFKTDHVILNGDNGLGKSIVFDAVRILLTHKDSIGQLQFYRNPVFTRNADGTIQHGVDATIFSVWEIEDKETSMTNEVTLQVTYRENKQKEGEEEQENRGMTAIYYINSRTASITMKKYDEFIAENFGELNKIETLFDANFFFNQTPIKQREILFEICNNTNIDLSPFAALIERCKKMNLTPADLRSQTKSEINRIDNDIKEAIIRHDQTIKNAEEIQEDWQEIEKKISSLKKQKADLQEKQSLIANTDGEKVEKERATLLQINTLRKKQENILSEAQYKVDEQFRKKNEEYQSYAAIVKEAENVCLLAHKKTAQQKEMVATAQRTLNDAKEQHSKAINQYKEATKNKADKICRRMIGECEKCEFNKECVPYSSNASIINNIVKFGLQCKENKEAAEKSLQKATADFELAKQEEEVVRQGLTSKQNKLASMKQPKRTIIEAISIKEYREIEQQIEELQHPTEQMKNREDDLNVNSPKAIAEVIGDIDAELIAMTSRLNRKDEKENLITIANKLQEQQAEMQDKKNALLLQYEQLTQLIKEQIRQQEAVINSMFKEVQFQLFEMTTDGKVNECCRVLIGGVPYDVANSASKINAKIELTDKLSYKYGIFLPLFIDNRETINSPIMTSHQRIEMRVTTDKKIRIDYL